MGILYLLLHAGIKGGKFMERGRIKKPNQPRYSTELSEYYQSHELYVGARVEFNNHLFLLIDADEYAFNYMDRHADEVRNRQGYAFQYCTADDCI